MCELGVVQNYQENGLIGKGGFGSVYHVTVNLFTDPCYLAMKSIPLTAQNLDEVRILERLNHPNIIKMLDYGLDEQNGNVLNIFLELANESLRQLMNHIKPFDEQSTKNCVKQILEGVCYMHSKDVIHRDLKPENVLVGSDGQLKITDFGISKNYTPWNMAKTSIGTPGYMSYEQANGIPYGEEADIWAIGIMTIEMLIGSCPKNYIISIPELTRHPILRYGQTNYRKGFQPSYKFPAYTSTGARNFVSKMTTMWAEDRPNAAQCLHLL